MTCAMGSVSGFVCELGLTFLIQILISVFCTKTPDTKATSRNSGNYALVFLSKPLGQNIHHKCFMMAALLSDIDFLVHGRKTLNISMCADSSTAAKNPKKSKLKKNNNHMLHVVFCMSPVTKGSQAISKSV